ncbi:hypothetical protein V7S43_009765 [Phytophthora oleae]|uniref:RxLR effector protein n=1 Tax=Phytophthora oleae TaxID=2107226 RepID=A0ABD3FDV7_9STRA
MQPAIRRDASAHDPAAEALPASQRVLAARLSKRPKDLYELWHEYQVGCGDLKAAKDFTTIERGANKFAYSRRKCFGTLYQVWFARGSRVTQQLTRSIQSTVDSSRLQTSWWLSVLIVCAVASKPACVVQNLK